MALKVGELFASLKLDPRQFYDALKQAERGLEGLSRKIETTMGPAAMNLSRGLVMAGAAAAAGIGVIGIASIKAAADMEQTKMAMETMLGSAEKAQTFLADLQRFAANTPFEFKGLVNSSKMMMAYGFAARDVIPMLTSVGDAAAGLGGGEEQVQSIVRALGQMQSKGKVSAQEMMQLSEQGVSAWKYLADASGKSIAEVQKAAEQGAIDSGAAIKAILAGMNQQFGGLMKKQSQTVNGIMSNIVDAMGQASVKIGQKLIDAFNIKGVLSNVAQQVGEFSAALETMGIGEALKKVIPEKLQATIMVVSGALLAAMVPALISVAAAASAAIIPLLPFIAAGAALGGVAYIVYRNWEKVKPVFDKLIPVIKAVKDWFWSLWEDLKTIWNAVYPLIEKAVLGIIKAVGWLVDKMREHWGTLKWIFGGLAVVIAPGIAAMYAMVRAGSWLAENWAVLKTAALDVWGGIKARVLDAIGGILDGYAKLSYYNPFSSNFLNKSARDSLLATANEYKAAAEKERQIIAQRDADLIESYRKQRDEADRQAAEEKRKAEEAAAAAQQQTDGANKATAATEAQTKATLDLSDAMDKAKSKSGNSPEWLVNNRDLVAARRAITSAMAYGQQWAANTGVAYLDLMKARTPNMALASGYTAPVPQTQTVQLGGTVRVEGYNLTNGQLVGVTQIMASELRANQDRFGVQPSARRLFK